MPSSSPPHAVGQRRRRRRDDEDVDDAAAGDIEHDSPEPSSQAPRVSKPTCSPFSSPWALAFDAQVVGGCRGDERLKPLFLPDLKLGVQERFLAHLTQHFEAFEIGLLVRCLWAPLVSVRVGKVDKQGSLLCPNAARGYLNLCLLPSSSMRLSFIGDDGNNELLACLTNGFDGSEPKIEELLADVSGRTFQLKLADSSANFYWCAEKMKQHGMELIAKMKDLLKGRPTLSQLTGISNARLDAFVMHLQAFLVGSSIGDMKSMAPLNAFLDTSSAAVLNHESSTTTSEVPRSHSSPVHATNVNSVYQASLSPRSSTSFKDGLLRSSEIKIIDRERLKRRAECQPSLSTPVPSGQSDSAGSPVVPFPPSRKFKGNKLEKNEESSVFSSGLSVELPFSSVESLAFPPIEGSAPSSSFKPRYCWCPAQPPSHQMTPPFISLSAPPLASMLENQFPSVPANLGSSDLPTLKLQPLIQDPMTLLKLSSSPLVSLPCTEVPTFTPLMSDTIVHIPVIDVCSSGPTYFVSAGSAISSSVPTHSTLVGPFMPETESLVERSARETIMRLIASAPSGSGSLLTNFPEVLDDFSGHRACAMVGSQNVTECSSQLSGTGVASYVGTVAIGISAMSLQLSVQEPSLEDNNGSIDPRSISDHQVFSDRTNGP